jgi:hypothetical protein
MWAFFSRRLRMWLILAVGAPVAAWLLGKVGDVIESRKGPNTASRALQKARAFLLRRSRGPLTGRSPADPAGTRDAGAPAR